MVVDHPLVGIVGGAFLLLAGIIIGYTPLQFTMELIMFDGATLIELGIALLVFFTGVGILLRVGGVGAHRDLDLSTLLGGAGVLFSLLSVFSALGGFVTGTVLGVVGGVICIVWQPPPADPESPTESDDHHVGTD